MYIVTIIGSTGCSSQMRDGHMLFSLFGRAMGHSIHPDCEKHSDMQNGVICLKVNLVYMSAVTIDMTRIDFNCGYITQCVFVLCKVTVTICYQKETTTPDHIVTSYYQVYIN